MGAQQYMCLKKNKRGDKMKRIFLKILLFCFAFVLLTPIIQIHAKDFNWYVKRNSEHKQPLCDAELSFIEQNGGIYVDKNHLFIYHIINIK